MREIKEICGGEGHSGMIACIVGNATVGMGFRLRQAYVATAAAHPGLAVLPAAGHPLRSF